MKRLVVLVTALSALLAAGGPLPASAAGTPQTIATGTAIPHPEEASPSALTIKGDSLYVAVLRGQRVWRLPFRGTTISSATGMLQGMYGRVRAVAQNPKDGSAWLMSSNNGLSGTDRPGDDRVVRYTSFP